MLSTNQRGDQMSFVWIDTVECMGAGTCEQIVPEVFTERRDGTWAVKEDARYFGVDVVFDGATAHAPEGSAGRARVPEQLLELVVEAADECPGECIHVEV